MDDRSASFKAAIQRAGQKRAEAVAKKHAKRQKKANSTHLFAEWVAAMREVYGEDLKIPKWPVEDKKLATRLIREQGWDTAVEVIRHFVSTWKGRMTREQRARNELPPFKLCWTIRVKLLAEIDGIATAPKSREEQMERGEFDADESECQSGWGDDFEERLERSKKAGRGEFNGGQPDEEPGHGWGDLLES
jgi:hypothetical protein